MKILLISLLFQLYGVNGLKWGDKLSSPDVADSIKNPAVFEYHSDWKFRTLAEFAYVSTYERNSRLVYDRFNSSIGEFTEYSGTYSYFKPTNLTVSLSKKFLNLVAGYKLLRSYEYRYDRYLRSDQNASLEHEYLITHGGANAIFGGFALKGKIMSLGFEIYKVTQKVDANTNLYYNQKENFIRHFTTFGVYGNIDVFPRVRVSFNYMKGKEFPIIRLAVYGPWVDIGTGVPEELFAAFTFTPPSLLVTEATFEYGRIGGYPYVAIRFLHNFLDIYPFSFSGGVYETDDSLWVPFFSMGAGVNHKNFRFFADVTYRNLKRTYGTYRDYYSEVILRTTIEYKP